MRHARYFIERRTGPKDYHPIGTQPAEGFVSAHDAIEWLRARGWVRPRLVDGETVMDGMGGQRGYYVRALPLGPAVAHVVEDIVLIGSYGEFVQLYGRPPTQRSDEMAARSWRDELRDRARRVWDRLRRMWWATRRRS